MDLLIYGRIGLLVRQTGKCPILTKRRGETGLHRPAPLNICRPPRRYNASAMASRTGLATSPPVCAVRGLKWNVEKSLKKEIWNPYGIHVCDAEGIRHNTRPLRTSSRAYSSARFSGGIYHLRSQYEVIDPAKTSNRGNLVVDIRLRDKKFSIFTAPSFRNTGSNEAAQFLNGKFHLLLAFLFASCAPKPDQEATTV